AEIGEQATVDLRVQRLDPTVEHFGRTRDCLDPSNRDSGRLERGGSVARGHNLDAQLVQGPRQLDQSGLVVYRDQRTFDLRPRAHASAFTILSITSGYNRRSTSLMRSCRVSSVSPSRTGTASCARIGPSSTSSVTRWMVGPVTLTPNSS